MALSLDWRELVAEIKSYAEGKAKEAIAPFTIGGKLNRGTPNAVGSTPVSGGGTGHDRGAEPPLGNPAANGYHLASTTAGVRSWVPADTGGSGDAVLGGDGEIPSLYLPSTQETGTVPEAGRWVRTGTILDPTEGYEDTAVGEPAIVVADGEIKLYYTAGWDTPALALATCPLTADPTDPGNWTKQGAVLGQGASGYADAACHHGVFLIGGTYYAYFTDVAASDLFVSTSPDGLAWGTPTTAIAASQVAWADWWCNPMVWQEGSAWLMLVEGRLGSGTWFIARATSTDGLTWTIQGAGPLTDLQVTPGGAYSGPFLPQPPKRDGLYQLWFHAAAAAANLPSDIWRATSPNLTDWTLVGATPVLTHTGSAPEVDQVADVDVVEIFGKSYLFYDALDNPSEASVIRIATIDATLAQVVDEAPQLTGDTGLDAEQVQDIVGALVVAGAGVSATYDDAGASLTLRASAWSILTDGASNIIYAAGDVIDVETYR